MNGKAMLEHTAGILRRRDEEYGPADRMLEHVAKRWTLTLGAKITAAQVALCLIDLKMARLAHNPKHLDSMLDVAGYAACLREVTRDV